MPDPSEPYPEKLAIEPLAKPAHGSIRVPGSKSMTNRALVLGALSGPILGSELSGALRSEDTEVMIEGLRRLGFEVQTTWQESWIHIRRGPHPGPIPAPTADIYVANSGTSMRFLTALASLGNGRYRLDGVAR